MSAIVPRRSRTSPETRPATTQSASEASHLHLSTRRLDPRIAYWAGGIYLSPSWSELACRARMNSACYRTVSAKPKRVTVVTMNASRQRSHQALGLGVTASCSLRRGWFERIQKPRQSCADVRVPWRIGAGASTCESGAGRGERQRAAKLAGIRLRQRSGCDPSDGTQRKQQGRPDTAAAPDGIRHVDSRRLDFNLARFFMPCLSPSNSARNDDQTRAR